MNTAPNVLVVAVDTQGDFVLVRGLLPVKGAQEMIGAMTAYVATLDPNEVAGFLATFDTHDLETFIGSPENLGDETLGIQGFDIHCEKGTAGWENVINLRIPHALGIPTYKLEKGVFDMWEEPNIVIERLHASEPVRARRAFFERQKARGVDTIRIFGFASDFCVRWAIEGFLLMGFKVQIVEDLVAGIVDDMRSTVAKHFDERFPGMVEFVR